MENTLQCILWEREKTTKVRKSTFSELLFCTYADTIIVRCVGSAFLTIADHKVLAVHMGVVLTHCKTKSYCTALHTYNNRQKSREFGKVSTHIHIWSPDCPPAACDIHHRTCVWRWRVWRNNGPPDSWSGWWLYWSTQILLISDIARGPQNCTLEENNYMYCILLYIITYIL